MPIFGHTFFGQNSAICGLIEPEIFMGTQETIIYRLPVRNLSYDAYFWFLIFWATFGGKMGVATTRTVYVLGPPILTISVYSHLQIMVSENFGGEPHTP